MKRRYWQFYWPLTLMGMAVLLGRLAQNYVLLDYPRGVQELAVFALAYAAFGPFRAGLIFVPHMTNVLVRGPKSLRAALRFVASVCLLLTVPIVLLAWTPLGPLILPRIYDIGTERIARLVLYLRYLSPLIFVFGLSHFFVGLLVQARRTGTVTALRVLEVALVVAVLAVGLRLGWEPVLTISLSIIVPRCAHLLLSGAFVLLLHHHASPEKDEPLPQRRIAAYFLPMLGTSVLFAVTRPIVFAFLTSLNPSGDPALPDVDAMVAGVSLAFTFTMIFHAAVNQFRHLFVTFGKRDPTGVRRFMVRVTGVVTVLLVAAALSPVAETFFRLLQGATGRTLRMATQAMLPLCLVPAAICFRNYYHGIAMVHRRTGGMAVGSVMRNLSVLVLAALLTAVGWYNHVWAAAMLVVGFASEATTVMLWTRGWRQEVLGEAAMRRPDR
jgi:hypothetical protein